MEFFILTLVVFFIVLYFANKREKNKNNYVQNQIYHQAELYQNETHNIHKYKYVKEEPIETNTAHSPKNKILTKRNIVGVGTIALIAGLIYVSRKENNNT
jgi:hypothetical protein